MNRAGGFRRKTAFVTFGLVVFTLFLFLLVNKQTAPHNQGLQIDLEFNQDHLGKLKKERNLLQKNIQQLVSQLSKVSSQLDNYVEYVARSNDPEWAFLESSFISGWTRNYHAFEFQTLVEAKQFCKEEIDCSGVTQVGNIFELRQGPDIHPSTSGESSWALRLPPCTDFAPSSGVIDENELTESYPVLKTFRRRRPDGSCVYIGKYVHLNELVKFDNKFKPRIIQKPSLCNFGKVDSKKIIFGIKTLPQSATTRIAIRETWLNRSLWRQLGYDIKIVFVLGNSNEVNLTDEYKTHDDLLVLDMPESHYNLPFKDRAFLKFIKDSCSDVDFVFKGDDDVLVVPQNIKHELEKFDNTTIEATGCKKPSEQVIRNAANKYFVPDQLYSADKYQDYFSGAGYIMTTALALELVEVIDEVSIIPLDDCWIGLLLNHIGKSHLMGTSESICAGVMRFVPNSDVCLIKGLTVAHKFSSPEVMKETFMKLNSNIDECDFKSLGISKSNAAKMKDSYKEAWEENFKKYKPLDISSKSGAKNII